MRWVLQERLTPGMILATPVRMEGGNLPRGTFLDGEIIARIIASGPDRAFVEDGRFDRVSYEPPVPASFLEGVMAPASSVFDAAETGQVDPGLLDRAREAVSALVSELVRRTDRILSVPDPRSPREYLPRHGVRTMLMCLLTANRLGWPLVRMEALALAGLFCDLGMARVPERIRSGTSGLGDGDWAEIRKHPARSAELVEGILSDEAREIILAHHERLNGEGYPVGTGGAMSLPARVLAFSDSFDAMTSSRPWRKGMPPNQAFRVLAEEVLAGKLDPVIGEAFGRVIAPYPLGTWVRLTSGYIGMVVSLHDWTLNRPDLLIVAHFRRGLIREPFRMELSRTSGVGIRAVLPGDPWETGEREPFREEPLHRRSRRPEGGVSEDSPEDVGLCRYDGFSGAPATIPEWLEHFAPRSKEEEVTPSRRKRRRRSVPPGAADIAADPRLAPDGGQERESWSSEPAAREGAPESRMLGTKGVPEGALVGSGERGRIDADSRRGEPQGGSREDHPGGLPDSGGCRKGPRARGGPGSSGQPDRGPRSPGGKRNPG
jgi:HD-GYP domain-containing protein (c-di-GMP phosphodiesterase class II)